MEGFALGYMPVDTAGVSDTTTEKAEQNETKSTDVFDELKDLMTSGMLNEKQRSDLLWALLILLLVFGGKSRDELSSYWCGKYERLKELCERKEGAD